MDGILDRASPRRGSLTSLHRQTSGSFSSTTKLASPSGSLQANANSVSNLQRDLDKFTRHFIIKSIQVIVQSRIHVNKRLKAENKPLGNDWFNINILDIAEVSDRIKAVLETEGLSVKSNWRICCEISLKSNDGGSIILEHWIISNRNTLFPAQRASSNHSSPKNLFQSNRTPNTPLTNSNNGIGPLSAINSASSGRARTSTIGNTVRTRLNSIDDWTGDNNFAANKLLMGANNENYDIKSSTSCYSLSSASHQVTDQPNAIRNSPSISSLSNNNANLGQQAHSANNNSSSPSSSSKTSAMSSIYTIYNRMSLLLKSLMTTTHIVPAYRLVSKSSQMDSCGISYRVYITPTSLQNSTPVAIGRGSIEDVSCNSSSESPNRRSSSSGSSFGSVNIREFVSLEELDHFCPILTIGSIKTEVNQLDLSLCYRTDIKSSNYLSKSPRGLHNRLLDEDCIIAAKQLLAGNDIYGSGDQSSHHLRRDPEEHFKAGVLNSIDRPLKPAFATKDDISGKSPHDPNLELIESAFDKLLEPNRPPNDDVSTDIPTEAAVRVGKNLPRSTNGRSKAQSDPIQVPRKSKHIDLHLSSGSTPKSLTDSYVFVDLNPPFASEDQNEISSFFHGPSPSFNHGYDNLKDVDDLTNQLAVIEANAGQIDDFIDNICISEDEEENS